MPWQSVAAVPNGAQYVEAASQTEWPFAGPALRDGPRHPTVDSDPAPDTVVRGATVPCGESAAASVEAEMVVLPCVGK